MYHPSHQKSLAKQIAVKSAVNPSVWICFVIALPLYAYAPYAEGWFGIAYFIIATILISIFAGSYIYLLVKNPDYLRSEEYQIKAESLKLFGSKDNPLDAEAGDVVAVVTNPDLPPSKNLSIYD